MTTNRNSEKKPKQATTVTLFFQFGFVAICHVFLDLFLIPSYFSLSPYLTISRPFCPFLLPLLLCFSQSGFLLALLSALRRVCCFLFLFGSYHHQHPSLLSTVLCLRAF